MSGIPISIGMQCTTASYFKEKGIRTLSFPFDWILSNPAFVFEMLNFLLKENMDVTELVTKHFYVLDKKVFVDLDNAEHYVTINDETKPNKLNSKYDAVFPHDYASDQNEVKEKYIRRFQRLKDLILDKTIQLDFYYVSQSSSTGGNYTIDGREVVTNVFENLKKIYDLISEYHGGNFKLIIFDTLNSKSKSVISECKNVQIYSIAPKDRFFLILPEILSIQI